MVRPLAHRAPGCKSHVCVPRSTAAVLLTLCVGSVCSVFANSYAVPGPGGRDWVYYDNSMPLPPQPHEPPSLSEQWNSMTKLIKLFIVLLGVFWLFHWSGLEREYARWRC